MSGFGFHLFMNSGRVLPHTIDSALFYKYLTLTQDQCSIEKKIQRPPREIELRIFVTRDEHFHNCARSVDAPAYSWVYPEIFHWKSMFCAVKKISRFNFVKSSSYGSQYAELQNPK